MIWLSLLLPHSAHARDVTHTGRAANPDPAWYVLLRPTTCSTAVEVGSNGIPVAAKAQACSAVLRPAIEAAALRWRFAPGPRPTLEVVDVGVRPPHFAPRSTRRECRLGFEVAAEATGQVWPMPLEDVPPGCGIRTHGAMVDAPEPRATAAWCQVDVVRGDGGLRSEVGACSDGYAEVALRTVAAWDFAESSVQRWQIVLGFHDADMVFY